MTRCVDRRAQSVRRVRRCVLVLDSVSGSNVEVVGQERVLSWFRGQRRISGPRRAEIRLDVVLECQGSWIPDTESRDVSQGTSGWYTGLPSPYY